MRCIVSNVCPDRVFGADHWLSNGGSMIGFWLFLCTGRSRLGAGASRIERPLDKGRSSAGNFSTPPRWFAIIMVITMLAGLHALMAAPAEAAPGDLDPAFGGDGTVTTDFAGGSNAARSIALQADGKIVIAGGPSGGSADFELARYNPNGSLDVTFGGAGRVTTDFTGGGFDIANGVLVQPDGKIVAAGQAGAAAAADFAVARYNPDGSLDVTFDGDGRVTTNFFSGTDAAFGVVIQPDDKIVVAGQAALPGDVPSNNFAVTRYNPDGSLDVSFDGDGKVTTDFDGDFDAIRGVVLQPDGKIVAAGHVTVSGDRNFGLARYNSNGSLDATFGSNGTVSTPFANFDFANGVVLQPDGKIVAAGVSNFFLASDFALARYNSDGSLDGTFDGDGKVTTDFAGGSGEFDNYASGLAIQADGKIVAAGRAPGVGAGDFGLARYNPNGSLNSGFGINGKVTTDFAGQFDEAFAVAIQTDGKIVAAGVAAVAGNADAALARYTGDPIGPSADLSITKIDSPDPALVNGVVTYTLTVTNNGPVSATGVTVTDTLPASVSLLSVKSSQGSCAPGPNCSIGDVANGANVTVTLVVEPHTAGPLTDTATVAGIEPDPTPGNNTATAITTITADAGCTITGTSGSDVLFGTPGNDVICGLSGNDTLFPGGGNDTVFGGSGNDTTIGSIGNDTVFGGSGNDTTVGNIGNDTVNGGTGADVTTGDIGNDTINSADGVSGNDTNLGGLGTNTCTFDPGDVTIC